MTPVQSGVTAEPRDPVRPVDMEFFCYLEVVEKQVRPMPGSYVRRKGVDARLPHLKTLHTAAGAVGPQERDELALYESIGMVRNRKTGHYYIAFRETMDLLLSRQSNLDKYPEWLMKHPVKRTELKIHVARVLGKPRDKYDRTWIEFLDETPAGEKIFDTISLFLLKKNILQEEMFSRS